MSHLPAGRQRSGPQSPAEDVSAMQERLLRDLGVDVAVRAHPELAAAVEVHRVESAE